MGFPFPPLRPDEPSQAGRPRVGPAGLIRARRVLGDVLHCRSVWQFGSRAFSQLSGLWHLAAESSCRSRRDNAHPGREAQREQRQEGAEGRGRWGTTRKGMCEKLKRQRLSVACLIITDKLKRLQALERWQDGSHGDQGSRSPLEFYEGQVGRDSLPSWSGGLRPAP